jgi:hypothetical protein
VQRGGAIGFDGLTGPDGGQRHAAKQAREG